MIENVFGHTIKKDSHNYAPYSIYLRGTICTFLNGLHEKGSIGFRDEGLGSRISQNWGYNFGV